jgi:hypothetical protein
MENTNGSDYVKDLECLENVLTILLRLQEWLEENPVRYPDAMRAFNTVLFGLIPRIQCECPECGKEITISAGMPCGGIADAYDSIESAIEALDLEILFGGESDDSVHGSGPEGAR